MDGCGEGATSGLLAAFDAIGIAWKEAECCTPPVFFLIVLFVLQASLATLEILTGTPIIIQFGTHVSDLIDNSTIAKSDPLFGYYFTWSLGYAVTWFVAFSELALTYYCLIRVRKRHRSTDRTQHNEVTEKTRAIWMRVNFVVALIFDDALVSYIKVFLALRFVGEIIELQTVEGQISSMATFVITVIRCLMVSVTILINAVRDHYTRKSLMIDLFGLFAGFVALSPAAISMGISWSLYDVNADDVNSGDIYGWLFGSVAFYFGWVGILFLIFKCILKMRSDVLANDVDRFASNVFYTAPGIIRIPQSN